MKTIDKYHFGDIVLLDLKFTNQKKSKLRPVMVLHQGGDDIILLKMTSKLVSQGLKLTPDKINNLRTDTRVDFHQIGTYHEALVTASLGKADRATKSEVKDFWRNFVEGW